MGMAIFILILMDIALQGILFWRYRSMKTEINENRRRLIRRYLKQRRDFR